jgi:glycosyltransferase involved in cell wall biosynthesis
LLYQDGNVASLADAVDRLVTDRKLRRAMSAAARETVLGEYTLDRMVQGFEQAVRYCAELSSR